MSTLSETIQYTQLATTNCQEVASGLLRAGEVLTEVERSLQAGLDGTGYINEIGQYYQLAAGSLVDAQRAVQQLHEQLQGLVAQFH